MIRARLVLGGVLRVRNLLVRHCSTALSVPMDNETKSLEERIKCQGDVVRQLKASNAAKDKVNYELVFKL